MGITFFETMSGELIDNDGGAHHLAMDLRCDASRITQFARNGRATITGTLRVQPWVNGVGCEGTITVNPVLGRRIEYDVTFTDADEAQWRLHGHKAISARRPIESMTVMTAQLDREGVRQANGTLAFQLDDLLPFLLSWRLGSTVTPSRDARQAPPLVSEKPLTDRERATMLAFARTVITPGGAVPEADRETMAAAVAYLPQLPGHVQLGVRAGLATLNARSRARYRRRFVSLPPTKRRRVVDAIRSSTTGEVLMLALGLPVKMAHFSRRDYLNGVGMPTYQAPQPEPEPKWLAGSLTPDDLPPRQVLDCDVVVIGTGAGGGPLAARLAEQGHGVVMVEAGQYFHRTDFGGNPVDRMISMWREAGMNLSVGNAPVGIPVGRTVGGSTTINSGIAIRTPDAVLGEWLDMGFPQDFRPEAFSRHLDAVAQELGIGPGEPQHLGRIADIVARGADQLGATHGALPRNSPGCDGQGQCVFGCPSGAKRGSDVSWVPRALKAGAGLYSQMQVTRILMRGNRAVGVLAKGQDRNGAPRELELRSKAVAVAAGALHTPLLLQRNGVRLPQLGRNLSIHPALGMMLRLPDSGTQPWNAIPMGVFVDSKVDPLVKHEGFYMPPQLAGATMPFDGPELTGWMADWNRVAQFGFMVRDENGGRVASGPGGRPLVRYSLTPRVVEAFRRGSAELAEILLRGGATQVETRIAGVGSVSDIYSARAIATSDLNARSFRSMGFHPLGTARLAPGPDTGVVDFDHQVFGTRDLFVVDGASVPTSLGVNPQVTIMAHALRAAEIISDRLDRQRTVLPETRATSALQPA